MKKSVISNDGGCEGGMRERLKMARSATAKLSKIWKDFDTTRATKFRPLSTHFLLQHRTLKPGLSRKLMIKESMPLKCGYTGGYYEYNGQHIVQTSLCS